MDNTISVEISRPSPFEAVACTVNVEGGDPVAMRITPAFFERRKFGDLVRLLVKDSAGKVMSRGILTVHVETGQLRLLGSAGSTASVDEDEDEGGDEDGSEGATTL